MKRLSSRQILCNKKEIIKMTVKEMEEKFLAEINEIGVKNFAKLDAPGGMQAYDIRLANGNRRFWKVRNSRTKEFESKLRIVEQD